MYRTLYRQTKRRGGGIGKNISSVESSSKQVVGIAKFVLKQR
jgi:hypothetical protein